LWGCFGEGAKTKLRSVDDDVNSKTSERERSLGDPWRFAGVLGDACEWAMDNEAAAGGGGDDQISKKFDVFIDEGGVCDVTLDVVGARVGDAREGAMTDEAGGGGDQG